MRSIIFAPFGRTILLFLLTLATALPAAAQPFTIEIIKDEQTARPNSTTRLTIRIKNQGSTEATGRFFERVFLAIASGASFHSVTNSDLRVACTAQGVVAGSAIYTCFCDPITIPAGGTVETTVDVTIPPTAAPGTTIALSVSFQFGNGPTTGTGTLITVGPDDGPRLTVSVRRDPPLIEPKDGRFDVTYELTVTNVGNQPTQGEISIDPYPSQPPGSGPIANMSFPPGQGNWQSRYDSAANMSLKTSDVLQPQQSVRLRLDVTYRIVERGGNYTFQARASGGGSPTSMSNVDTVKVDSRLLSPIPGKTPAPTSGRPR